MKYCINENNINSDDFLLISQDFDFKNLKSQKNKEIIFKIDFNALNLTTRLYGNNKKDTRNIQKNNCKKVIRVYRTICNIIKICKRNNIKFNNMFFVYNFSTKKNNNDLMLLFMLETRFNKKIGLKYQNSLLFACDYLDNELKTENMCDFQENQCIKHRVHNFSRKTGCCPPNCKHIGECGCLTKNLSCKLILCDYLIKKGYYFSPLYLPILAVNMTIIERLCSWGMFFKSTKKTFSFMNFIRIFEIVAMIIVMAILLVKII